MPLNGKVQGIDRCIHHIVEALNAGGVWTASSCCGHKVMKGMIALEDGRLLLILPETPKSVEEWSEVMTAPMWYDKRESR